MCLSSRRAHVERVALIHCVALTQESIVVVQKVVEKDSPLFDSVFVYHRFYSIGMCIVERICGYNEEKPD